MHAVSRTSPLSSAIRASTTPLALALLASLGAARQHKLSAPLPTLPGGFVSEVQVSPDGAWAVYLDSGVFSTPIKGERAPVQLGAPYSDTSIGVFRSIRITSDSTRVVFVQSGRLLLAPIEGATAPVTLADDVGPALALTPDGQRAIFTAAGPAGTPGLFSVLLRTGAETVPLDPAPDGEVQDDIGITSDSIHVVYRVRNASSTRIFAARVDGSAPPRDLTPSASSGVVPPGFQLGPDGARVVFLWDPGQASLYGAPLEGQAPAVKLNPAQVAGAEIPAGFQISPDGSRVYYRAQLAGRTRLELYRVPIEGGQSSRLSPELVHSGFVRAFGLTADGRRIVYLADHDAAGVVELYTLPADGSAPARRLNGALVQGGDVLEFHLSPDGARVVYRADQEVDGQPALYAAPLGRPANPLRLGESPFENRAGPSVRFSPDGTHLVFTTQTRDQSWPELRSVRADGSEAARVLAPEVEAFGSSDRGFQLVPGRPDVVCRSPLELEDQFELFRVALEGEEPPLRLSAPLLTGRVLGQVEDFQITSDSRWAVYRTSRVQIALAGEPVELSGQVNSVSLDGERRIVSLYPAGAAGSEEQTTIAELATSPDGRWVAIRAQNYDYGRERLYAAPVDGRQPTIPISEEAAEFYLWGFGVNDRFVYTSVDWDPETGYEFELLSVPADGSAAPIELSADLPASGELEYYFARIDPTGQRVVFFFERGDAPTVVYCARVDGSEPPVRLSSSDTGELYDAQFSVDGRLVVFTAAEAGSDLYQTYSVPADGSAPPTRLNPRLAPSGRAILLRYGAGISPDGSRVLLEADLDGDGAFDLLSVPIAGGPAIQLNPPLVAGGSVRKAHFSPDGTRVVYLADQEQDEVFELFSVPSAGGAAPVKLNQALVPGGDVSTPYNADFLFTPDGARVVYLADAVFDDRFELWSAPIAGGAPIRLSAKLPADADVLPVFRLSRDGKRVLYQANSLDQHVFELFVAETDRAQSGRRVHGAL